MIGYTEAECHGIFPVRKARVRKSAPMLVQEFAEAMGQCLFHIVKLAEDTVMLPDWSARYEKAVGILRRASECLRSIHKSERGSAMGLSDIESNAWNLLAAVHDNLVQRVDRAETFSELLTPMMLSSGRAIQKTIVRAVDQTSAKTVKPTTPEILGVVREEISEPVVPFPKFAALFARHKARTVEDLMKSLTEADLIRLGLVCKEENDDEGRTTWTPGQAVMTPIVIKQTMLRDPRNHNRIAKVIEREERA